MGVKDELRSVIGWLKNLSVVIEREYGYPYRLFLQDVRNALNKEIEDDKA